MAENDNINLEITEAIVEAVSPTATVSKVGDTATITVTDKNGTTTASIKDGDKGDKGDQGDKGDKGDKGDTGNTGATGATPELTIGTVTTLDPTDPATATITGTDEQPILSLGIPKGVKGDTGNAGAAAGFGTVSASVDANIGTPAVSVTASGPDTAKNFAFAFHNLKGVKGDTGATGNGIASIEETATIGAVHTYTITYTNGDTTTFDVTDGEVTNASLATVLEDYARINGAYESMTVGNAEQLISSVTVNDKVPYNFRTSGGSIDIGNREVDKLVGGTIAWNQLTENGNFADTSNWNAYNCTLAVANNEATVTTNAGVVAGTLYQDVPSVSGHKYLIIASGKIGTSSEVRIGTENSNPSINESITASTYTTISKLVQATGASIRVALRVIDAEVTGTFKSIQLIDLTQMFGSTIADYVYSLEQATAGAGVAWFKKLFPKPYYAYNAGQLMSVKTSAHQMVGFNAWDEVWEVGTINAQNGNTSSDDTRIRAKNFCPCVPNTTYYVKDPTNNNNVSFRFYDADKNYLGYGSGWIGNTTFVTPANCAYFKFVMDASYGTTYNHDICINLSWDGERDGEYEAYKKWTYALDSDLELRGIPKLDASNNLYYDGDTYEDDGTVTRKYTIVDMGTLTWVKLGTRFYSTSINTIIKKGSYSEGYDHIVCDKYTAQNIGGLSSLSDKCMSVDAGGNLQLYDSTYSNNTEEELQTALNGVYLVYELATPTTAEADPYQNPQIVDDFGTEEYVDERTVAIPVGHDTEYMNNLKAKLEMSPDSPDGDGDYIVRQTNGENSYVPYIKELPTLPNEDGTYVLKCTVSGSTKTLSWVEEE